ncbi:PHD finger protein 7-like [Prinia subflava]|uniref:PHD finger protein 7-like n=1 Tax=Prinia subflava TaxID=208062 RepID=UPI002FDF6B0E
MQPPVGQSLAPSSSTEALAQEPPPPGASVGSDPAVATSCALPGAVGLPGGAPRPLLMELLGSRQRCCVCGQSGATIMCCEENCDRWFHLPCAKEGGCVTQYISNYSSYCSEHRPEQDVQETPEPDTKCPICLEPVEDRNTFTTMVCPACKRAWFHRDCIQGQAMRSGLLCLHCPLCRDLQEFLVHMFIMGIRVPFRLPTWEDNDAFADLEERHSWCNARKCLYPGGREQAEEEGPWELLLCSSCAAEGTHRRCSGLTAKRTSWECDSCAGLGTAPRDVPEINGCSLAGQSRLGPSHSSPESEDGSSSSSSPGPSGLAPQTLPLETHSRSRRRRAASQQLLPYSSRKSRSRSAHREATPGSENRRSSDPEHRVRSRCAGPDCRRNRSRQQERAPAAAADCSVPAQELRLTAAMCDRKEEAPDAREPACMLCHRTEADPDICGNKVEKFGLCAHTFCLATIV